MPKPSQPDLAAQPAHSRCAAHRLRSVCAHPKRSRWCHWCHVPAPEAPKPPKQKRSYAYAFALPTTLQLSRVAMSRLHERAEAMGVTEAALAATLLEMIVQDDLYDAVLDTEDKKISA